jgi:hypothetical protein
LLDVIPPFVPGLIPELVHLPEALVALEEPDVHPVRRGGFGIGGIELQSLVHVT